MTQKERATVVFADMNRDQITAMEKATGTKARYMELDEDGTGCADHAHGPKMAGELTRSGEEGTSRSCGTSSPTTRKGHWARPPPGAPSGGREN